MVKICSDIYSNEEKYNQYFNGFPYQLNSFQKHSIEALVDGHHALVTAATGCGKSTCFQFAAEYFVGRGKKLIYCSPVKSLSNQMYYNLIRKYPHISVGILTGDFKINPDASVLIVTTEILCNTLMLKAKDKENNNKSLLSFDMDFDKDLACVVFDEFHYINDRDRGNVWENSIMLLPSHVQLLMLSATLDKPEKIAQWIENRYRDNKQVYIASTLTRSVPLTHYNFITSTQSIFKILGKNEELKNQVNGMINRLQVIQTADGVFNDTNYHKMTKVLDLLEQKKVYMKSSFVLNQVVKHMVENKMLPAICFILSRKQIDRIAHEISVPLLEEEESYNIKKEAESILRKKIPNYMEYIELPEYIELISLLEKGIGKHHAGMITILREIVELFLEKGYIKLLLTTETFAIGVNFAIKTVLFTDINKFDGNNNRMLLGHEFTQMSGRAGRLGIDTVGNVIHLNNLFRDINLVDYKNMMKGTPQILSSKFKLSYNLLLNLIERDKPAITQIENLEENTSKLVEYCKKSMIQHDIDKELASINEDIYILEKEKISDEQHISSMRTPKDIVIKYIELNQLKSTVANKKRKEVERSILTLIEENKYIEKDNFIYLKYLNTLTLLEKANLDYINTKQYLNDNIKTVLDLLEEKKFIKKDTNYILTKKGEIATQLREVHCLTFANLLEDKEFLELSPKDMVCLLSCLTNVSVVDELKAIKPSCYENIIKKINSQYDIYSNFELKYQIDTGSDYTLHYDLIDIMKLWCTATSSDDCKYVLQKLLDEKGIVVGEFIKATMKITCIVNELEKIAESIMDIELLSKLKEIPLLIQKYVAINQSLYL